MGGFSGERVGLNEAAFRRVNEDIRRSTGTADVAGTLAIRCECAALGCSDIVIVTVAEYERVRQDPRRFIVARGHVIEDAEQVVEDLASHLVVEKTDPDAVAAVEATDPRG